MARLGGCEGEAARDGGSGGSVAGSTRSSTSADDSSSVVKVTSPSAREAPLKSITGISSVAAASAASSDAALDDRAASASSSAIASGACFQGCSRSSRQPRTRRPPSLADADPRTLSCPARSARRSPSTHASPGRATRDSDVAARSASPHARCIRAPSGASGSSSPSASPLLHARSTESDSSRMLTASSSASSIESVSHDITSCDALHATSRPPSASPRAQSDRARVR